MYKRKIGSIYIRQSLGIKITTALHVCNVMCHIGGKKPFHLKPKLDIKHRNIHLFLKKYISKEPTFLIPAVNNLYFLKLDLTARYFTDFILKEACWNVVKTFQGIINIVFLKSSLWFRKEVPSVKISTVEIIDCAILNWS